MSLEKADLDETGSAIWNDVGGASAMKHTLSGTGAPDNTRSGYATSSARSVSPQLFSDWFMPSNKPLLIVRSDMTISWVNLAAQKILDDGTAIAVRNGKLISPLIDLRGDIQAGLCSNDATIIAVRPADDALAIHCVLRVRALADPDGTTFFGIQIGDPRSMSDDWLNAIEHLFKLTRRQRDVLALLVSGVAADKLADELNITVDTARTHIRTIYQKLGVKSREELFAKVRPFYL